MWSYCTCSGLFNLRSQKISIHEVFTEQTHSWLSFELNNEPVYSKTEMCGLTFGAVISEWSLLWRRSFNCVNGVIIIDQGFEVLYQYMRMIRAHNGV